MNTENTFIAVGIMWEKCLIQNLAVTLCGGVGMTPLILNLYTVR
jgi:hypothetical protein